MELYEMIKCLAVEVKNDGRTWKIVAKRLLDDFDDDYDYSQYKFLCPFHNDNHKGNFVVKRGGYKCYSCGESGSLIDFIIKFDGVSFQEAVLTAAYELDIIDEGTYNSLRKGKTANTQYHKRNFVKEEKQVIANKNDLNYVYSLFCKGLTWLNKPKLSEAHYKHLKEVRHLSDEDIERNGYFTFPSIYILKYIIKQMKLDGKNEELLCTIPGFFYDDKKGKYSFFTIKNNGGIGIPIFDADGNIVGVQIRLDTVKEGEQRYVWFSSSFSKKGVSSGAPVYVAYPKGHDINNLDGLCCTIIITEGHFKAVRLANTFKAITLSVQGVHNYKEIPEILDYLKKTNSKFRHVYIMYDADMSFKESVLNPAIKLGLTLTNISLDDYNTKIDEIISTNKKYARPLVEMKDNFKSISDYLRQSAGSFKFDIVYCLWDDNIGKGIDDYLDAFTDVKQATSQITKIQIISFWEKAFKYLLDLEALKKEKSLREGIDNFHEVILDEDVKKDEFEKDFLK